jgi:hypothetical protein
MNPLVKIPSVDRFRHNAITSFSQRVANVLEDSTHSINEISNYQSEVISRKGILVPVHISIFQALQLYWLEMIVIITSHGRYGPRAVTLHKRQLEIVFSINAHTIKRKLIRKTVSSQPERIDAKYIEVKANIAHVYWFAIYEELHIQISGGILNRIIQPCVVIAHRFDTDWREALPVQRRPNVRDSSNLQDYYLNPDKVKCYVAQEFDSVYTWDRPMRNYFKQEIIPLMAELKIEMVYMPMAELRNSIMHSPDFSKINPFEENKKIIMDVKTSRNYYTSL